MRSAGARYRFASGRPRSLGPGAPKPAPLSFALCKDRHCGESASAAPKPGGQGAGAQGRRGEAQPARAAPPARWAEDSGRRARSAGEVIDGGARARAPRGLPPPAAPSPRRGAGCRAAAGRAGRGALRVVWRWSKSQRLTSSKLSRRRFPQTPKFSWWPPGLNPRLRKSNALRTGKPLSGYFGWAPKASCLDAPR